MHVIQTALTEIFHIIIVEHQVQDNVELYKEDLDYLGPSLAGKSPDAISLFTWGFQQIRFPGISAQNPTFS